MPASNSAHAPSTRSSFEVFAEIEEHCNCCGDCEHHEKPTSERAAFLKLAKSDAGILRVNEIKKVWNDYVIRRRAAACALPTPL